MFPVYHVGVTFGGIGSDDCSGSICPVMWVMVKTMGTIKLVVCWHG